MGSGVSSHTALRPPTDDELTRALGQLSGARSIPAGVLPLVARAFQVKSDREFELAISRRHLSSLGVAQFRVSEMRLRRLPFTRPDAVHLVAIVDGTIALAPKVGDEIVLRSGDLAVVSDWRPFDLECLEVATVVHVVLPGARLRERGAVVRSERFLLAGSAALHGPLVAIVGSILRSEWKSTSSALRVAERVIEDLVVAILLESADELDAKEQFRADLRRRAIEEIGFRHRDPALTPATLAKYVGVSLRHLQRSFENSGTTVSEQIIDRRARSAAELLAAPGAVAFTVREVAGTSGFASAFELRSAFRARFGVLPSEYRAHSSVAPDDTDFSAKTDPVTGDESIVVS